MENFRHLGYFNDKEDIEDLYKSDADEVVGYMKNKNGNFHHSTEDDDIVNLIDRNRRYGYSSDKKYIVMFSFNVEEPAVEIDDDCFIDVYEVVEE